MVELILFVVVGLVAVLAAIGVVAQRNVLYSGLLLVLNLLCLAALYILMGAQFVGIVQIIVYAGAIMVLILFTVMLLSGKRTEMPSDGLPGQAPLAVLFILALGAELALLLSGGLQGLGAVAGQASSLGNVQAVARLLFTRYLWAFEATGLLLLVAVVGVVYLVRGGSDSGAGR